MGLLYIYVALVTEAVAFGVVSCNYIVCQFQIRPEQHVAIHSPVVRLHIDNPLNNCDLIQLKIKSWTFRFSKG